MKIEKVVTSPLSKKRYFVRVIFNTDLVEKDRIEYDIFVYQGTKPTKSIFGIETQKPHIIHDSFEIETDGQGRLKEDLNPDRDISNLIIMYEAPYIYKSRLEEWDGIIRLENEPDPEPEPQPEPPREDDGPVIINWYDPPEVRAEKERLIEERRQKINGYWIIDDIETKKEKDAQGPTDPPPKRKRNRSQKRPVKSVS